MTRFLFLWCCLLLIHTRVAYGDPKWKQMGSAFESRIMGGEDTDISQVPYQVALLWDDYNFCGAAIISKNFLLTGAHCIVFVLARLLLEKISARVGSSYALKGGTLLKLKSAACHPKFDMDTYDYDICLLELEQPLVFSKNVQPVQIGTKHPQEGQMGLIAGWGTLSENGKLPEKLQSVVIPITNKTFCEEAYKNVTPVSERMFCAGSANKDSCQGDSGGGIVVENSLVGITSSGFGCGLPEYPGVYISLIYPEIREFIKNITNI